MSREHALMIMNGNGQVRQRLTIQTQGTMSAPTLSDILLSAALGQTATLLSAQVQTRPLSSRHLAISASA